MLRYKRIQYAALLWALVVSAMVAASAFPNYVQFVDPQFRDLGCQGCHAAGSPSSVVLEAKQISPLQAPLIDGASDSIWDSAHFIRINLTGGYDPLSVAGDESWSSSGAPLPWGTGNSTTVTVRALFDGTSANSNLYLQIQWMDPTDSSLRSPWFFDAASGKWVQANSTLYNEDKLAVFWQVGQVTGFEEGGCLITCHATTPGASNIRKYTPVAGDVLDFWFWRAARLDPVGQVDDEYMDYNLSRGIHNDPADNASLGYKTNSQTLRNGSANVSVPLYWIPGRTGYTAILLSEIDAHVAKKITSVDAANVLHDEDGTAVPTTLWIPSVYTSPFAGDRGHIAGKAARSGGGWMLEVKRTLQSTVRLNNTTVLSPYDVQFSDLSKPYYFAVAVFDNVGSGHQWHPGPYRLVFGEAPKPVPANLDVWGSSVGAAAFLVSGVGALTLATSFAKKAPSRAAKSEPAAKGSPPASSGGKGGEF